MGLDTPVIRTCRQDEMVKLAFDVRQYPFIPWERDKWEDFKKQLVDYATAHGLLAPRVQGGEEPAPIEAE